MDLSQNPTLAGDVIDDELELIIESPSGADRVVRPTRDSWFVRFEEPGFYRVRRLGANAGEFVAAANLDPSESDLTPVDVQELAGALITQNDADNAVGEAIILSAEERERRQGLWWYLLAAACTLLLAETLLSNRAVRAAT